MRATLRKISLLGDNLFLVYKVNSIINKFLLTRDKFMFEMHLRQPAFTDSACGLFAHKKKNNENAKVRKNPQDTPDESIEMN